MRDTRRKTSQSRGENQQKTHDPRIRLGYLQELKNKGKVQLGNSKSGHGRLLERFITMFKSHFKQGFTTLGGRN